MKCSFLGVFSPLTYLCTPGGRRKRLLHLYETAPAFLSDIIGLFRYASTPDSFHCADAIQLRRFPFRYRTLLSFSHTRTMASVSSSQYFKRFSRAASLSAGSMLSMRGKISIASLPLCTPSSA